MRRRFSTAYYILVFLAVHFLIGCNAPKNQLACFNEHFRAGELEKSIQYAESKLRERDKPKSEDLLWALQLGTCERLRGDYQKSTIIIS